MRLRPTPRTYTSTDTRICLCYSDDNEQREWLSAPVATDIYVPDPGRTVFGAVFTNVERTGVSNPATRMDDIGMAPID
jgi:hypothetical protein